MFGTLRRVPFAIWLLLGQLFVFAGASQIAPIGEAEHLKEVIIFYILFQVALLAYWRKRPAWMRATLNQGIAQFTAGFVVTVIVMVGVGVVRSNLGFGTFTYSVTAPIYLLILHSLVVAFSEEAIFRGLLSNIITAVPAAGAFALFHFWAYQGNVMTMFIAFLAGLFFYVVMLKFGIWMSMGIHAGYNTTLLGVWG